MNVDNIRICQYGFVNTKHFEWNYIEKYWTVSDHFCPNIVTNILDTNYIIIIIIRWIFITYHFLSLVTPQILENTLEFMFFCLHGEILNIGILARMHDIWVHKMLLDIQVYHDGLYKPDTRNLFSTFMYIMMGYTSLTHVTCSWHSCIPWWVIQAWHT